MAKAFMRMTVTNPYESSAILEDSKPGASTSRILLRGVAILSWLVSGLMLLFAVAAILSPQGRHLLHTETYSCVVLVSCTLILPALSFFLWGLACWLRSSRPAFWGLTLLIPLLLFVSIRLFS